MIATQARRAFSLATVLMLLLLPIQPAHAYVRAVTELGVPVWWRSPCIAMDIYLGSPPPTLTADQYWDASLLAAQAWSRGDISCTGLSISMSRHPEITAEVGLDGKNVIVFRQDPACQQGAATDPADPPCLPANALAVTTLFKNVKTGEIVDADMEINAEDFSWADLVADPTQANGHTADFQNTLTHELGHVLGLAHTCYSSNDGPAPLLDNTGNPEIACGAADVPASVTDATMYPAVATSDIERRTLSPDDVQGACAIYPAGQAACGAGSGQGCSVAALVPAGPPRPWAIGFASFLVLAFASWLHRRR